MHEANENHTIGLFRDIVCPGQRPIIHQKPILHSLNIHLGTVENWAVCTDEDDAHNDRVCLF